MTTKFSRVAEQSNDKAEKMIDVEVNLGKELADKINKMTKLQLIEKLVVMTLRNRVQDETVAEFEKANYHLSNVNKSLQTKIDVAQSYVEQGRSMIESVMERWHEYDV